jgi:hypothetical protein
MRPLVLLLVACAPKQAPLPAPVAAVDPYVASLEDAAFPLPAEVVSDLLTLTRDNPDLVWDDAGRVLVTSWTRSRFYADPAYQPGHAFPLYGETWFTAGAEVAEACAGLSGDAAALRVEQLLGLPPGGGRDVFLRVWIDPSTLFRPCFQPDVTQASCPIADPVKVSDGGTVSWSCANLEPGSHAAWLCSTWVARYGVSDPQQRYPWTALGYTYDWAPDAPDPRGATELVAPAGTTVVFHELVPNDQLCASSPGR